MNEIKILNDIRVNLDSDDGNKEFEKFNNDNTQLNYLVNVITKLFEKNTAKVYASGISKNIKNNRMDERISRD